MEATDEAGDIRQGESLDWDKLNKYLKSQLDGWSDKFSVSQFHGGHANLTYLIRYPEVEYVIRRPPFGKIAPGAHDMLREFSILSRLNPYYPKAPAAYHFCADTSIIGAPFVVMERRKGIVIRYTIPEVFKDIPHIENTLSLALVSALAELHKVDIDKSGLHAMGRGDGFLLRQLKGWKKRWLMAGGREGSDMSILIDRLSAQCPDNSEVCLIHNDFKFDNCQFDPNDPTEINSVFDWDMATIGDPLFDFASTLVYWPDDFGDLKGLPALLPETFPAKGYLKEKYFEQTGFDGSNMAWYESLAFWKTSVIARQLYARYEAGETKDRRMKKFNIMAEAFEQQAIKKARGLG